MICAGENQTFTAQDRESPAVLHGKSAAVIARQLGLSEECICAVRYHTTARVNMTLPEKILYFADFIEETRTHEVCRRFRTYFYENLPTTACEREAFLDEQIRSSLEETVRNLSEKNLPIHPDTLDALEFLKNERKNHDPI